MMYNNCTINYEIDKCAFAPGSEYVEKCKDSIIRLFKSKSEISNS